MTNKIIKLATASVNNFEKKPHYLNNLAAYNIDVIGIIGQFMNLHNE